MIGCPCFQQRFKDLFVEPVLDMPLTFRDLLLYVLGLDLLRRTITASQVLTNFYETMHKSINEILSSNLPNFVLLGGLPPPPNSFVAVGI